MIHIRPSLPPLGRDGGLEKVGPKSLPGTLRQGTPVWYLSDVDVGKPSACSCVFSDSIAPPVSQECPMMMAQKDIGGSDSGTWFEIGRRNRDIQLQPGAGVLGHVAGPSSMSPSIPK